ncbi:Helix-turn-helix domain-containing protein [Marinobacter sp. LV10R510-11A]|uniref:helix-turn-helix domain-containing protein n=1 Tax=Marinobacter sp. LV10R510-11A TaxID=1415568 RepID=UPI000BB8854E|nr:helix-turn-helix domain-containing protein [Marinobacter sp. LV10R510-11A]SOB74638.1 Helix-turn-helix domain-containing protein [Marinobacter sp. LV10R510-11A]
MDPYALSDDAWCKEIGSRLDLLRQSRGMSREDLGSETGVSQPTLRKLLDEGAGKLPYLVAALRAMEAMDTLELFIAPEPINPAVLLRGIRKGLSVSARGHSPSVYAKQRRFEEEESSEPTKPPKDGSKDKLEW